METEPTIFEQMNMLYNRPFIPVEFGTDSNNATKQLIMKFYDQMCYSDNEEKDFFTMDPITLRNTAINSLIGRGPITEEKIQNAIKAHLNEQKEFYENWKAQQIYNMFSYQ